MTINWTPSTAELFTEPETATSILYTVTVSTTLSGKTAVITGFTVTPDELPPQVSITFTGSVLTVSAPNLDGTYPIEVDYLLNGVYGQVTNWDDLPASLDTEIHRYWKHPTPPRIFDLAITSTDTVDTETRTYQMIVTPDYTPGRDRLVAEVDARR